MNQHSRKQMEKSPENSILSQIQGQRLTLVHQPQILPNNLVITLQLVLDMRLQPVIVVVAHRKCQH